MKKIAMSFAAATMLVSGLAACGGTESNDQKATSYEAQNLNGNYNGNRMNSTARYSGQGPLTDMMTPNDRSGMRAGNYGQYSSTRAQFDNYNNMYRRGGAGATNYTNRGLTGNNQPGMVGDDGLLRGRARDGVRNNALGNNNGVTYGTNHGMNNNRSRTMYDNSQNGMRNSSSRNNGYQAQNGTMNYHKNYDSTTAKKIATHVNRISGVNDARVIVNNNDVIVGIDTTANHDNVRGEVERTAKKLAGGGKNIHVVTDKDQVGRIRTMDNRLRGGSAFNEVGDMFTDIINDLGNAAKRPFESMR